MAGDLGGLRSRQFHLGYGVNSTKRLPTAGLHCCGSLESLAFSLMALGPTVTHLEVKHLMIDTYFHDASSNDHLLSRLVTADPVWVVAVGYVQIQVFVEC